MNLPTIDQPNININLPTGQEQAAAAATRLARQLLPCPFCGNDQPELANTHTKSFWVECLECGGQAHGEPSMRWLPAIKSAIAAWNRRA